MHSSLINQLNVLFYIDLCTSDTYKKADGSCACGFFLENGLKYKQATEECKSLGGRLPEIKTDQENKNILNVKVSFLNIIYHLCPVIYRVLKINPDKNYFFYFKKHNFCF